MPAVYVCARANFQGLTVTIPSAGRVLGRFGAVVSTNRRAVCLSIPTKKSLKIMSAGLLCGLGECLTC